MSKNTLKTPNESSYIYYAVVDNLYNTLDRRHILVKYIKSKDKETFKVVYNNSNFEFPSIIDMSNYFGLKFDYLYESTAITH